MPLFQRITSNTSLFRVFLATSYVKLQDAYASETNALGTWAKIGYAKPGGTNFNYAEDASTLTVTCAAGKASSDKTKCDDDGDVKGVVSTSTYTEAWSASNIADLNECTKGKNWVIAATIGQNNNGSGDSKVVAGTVSYNATIASSDCEALTPNFTAIGR